MSMTTREAFEKGTETFNSHDIAGFGEVLADDVVFDAPGGMHGKGKAACLEFYGSSRPPGACPGRGGHTRGAAPSRG